jgi:hypothetical protein
MRQGDFHVARPGSHHGLLYSEEGCLLFVQSPRGTLPKNRAAACA